MTELLSGRTHVDALVAALEGLDTDRVDAWGRRLATVLASGGRLLVAGNGGSAAQAQHLTAELVGRYRDDRPALSAIALHAETSALTAIGNDYGWEASFSRQVQAHGRPGDVLVVLSTSGRSPNILKALEAGRDGGLITWALVGKPGSPAEALADDTLCVDTAATATVQEVHQVAVHLLCARVDLEVGGVVVSGTKDPVEAAGLDLEDDEAPDSRLPAESDLLEVTDVAVTLP